jgi:Mlc titration factor MtfA (ptsG expression regulator)
MMNGRARKHQHTKLNLPSFKRLTQPTTQHLMGTALWYLVVKNFIHFHEINLEEPLQELQNCSGFLNSI